MYELGTDEAKCGGNLVNGRSVANAIRSLVNAMSLQLSVLGSCMRFCSYLFACLVVRENDIKGEDEV